tara:strand:- start:73 stop:633 length:561 start_codon:yes stop_codon:yes gene_type:complete
MTDTPTTSDLRALKLTEDEWHSLMHMGEFDPIRAHMDMLVLAGLAVRTHIHPPEWDLTEAGHAACNAIDLILDWDDFVFVGDGEDTEPFGVIQLENASDASDTVFLNGEPIERSEAVELASEAPKRIGVGSLVRHQHHGEGLVTDHFMWDGDWGGFRIKLLKPSQTGATTSITEFSDRADSFELVS